MPKTPFRKEHLRSQKIAAGHLNFAPFGKTKGSDKVSSKENGILLIKRLNSNGLKMQPCRTPLAY